MTLKTKLLAAFLVVTAVSVTLITGFALYFFFAKIKAEAVAGARRHLQVAELVYQHKLSEVRDMATFLAHDGSLQNFTLFAVKRKLQDYVAAFSKNHPGYEITVLGKKHRLLARARHADFGAETAVGVSLLAERVYREGKLVFAPEQVATDALLTLSAAAPVFTKTLKPQIAGVVLVRYRLDGNPALIARMESRVQGQVAIFHETQAISHTGSKPPPIEPPLYRALMTEPGSREVTDIRDGGYLGQYLTLYDAGNAPLAVLGLRIPAEPYLETMRQAGTRLLILMGGCLVVASLLAYLLAWGILARVNTLMDGVKRLSAGERHQPIVLQGSDELAGLAHAFNIMAAKLANAFNVLKNTIDSLTRAGNALAVEKDLDVLLKLLVREARAVCHARRSTLSLFQGWDPATPRHPDAVVRKILCDETEVTTQRFELSEDEKSPPGEHSLHLELRDRHQHPIAALQLEPRLGPDGQPVPFTPDETEIVRALAGQAAIAMENARNYQTIKRQNSAFARFVPGEFLTRLGKNNVEEIALGDASAEEMAVMFSDIREFTHYAEMLEPRRIFEFLNEYLQFAGPAITRHGGFIDKYIGDAVMALFPGDRTGAADDAVTAALELFAGLEAFNQARRQAGVPPIHIGVGIHTGPLVLGTIGFETRMETTVLGDTVNLASRIESLTKHYGISLAISGTLLAKLHNPHKLLLREVDTVQVKGREEATVIYEVFNIDPEPRRNQKQAGLPRYREALAVYKQGDWDTAESLFAALSKEYAADTCLAEVYIQRCKMYRRHPPAKEWQGITRLAAK